MEYEDILPFRDFAIRIPQNDIHRLPELLDDILQRPGRVGYTQMEQQIFPLNIWVCNRQEDAAAVHQCVPVAILWYNPSLIQPGLSAM